MIKFCSICARGGSKGFPGKNIRPLHGLPLIAHSILRARETELFDAIYVSSDNDDILSVASAHGADFVIKRPDELATDAAPKIPVIRHAMQAAEDLFGRACDLVVDLDATSPLRLSCDILGAVDTLLHTGAGNVFSVTPSRKSPYFNIVELEANSAPVLSKPLLNQVVRRQDAPPCFDINGSVYVWRRQVLVENDLLFLPNTRVFVMPEDRSIDIDSALDFHVVEALMAASQGS